MTARDADLIPVVQKSYDLCAGLYTHVNRFPRAQRGLLGRVILEDALAMLVSLTVANRRTDRMETLREASGRLDALRITLRLGRHLGFVSNGGYEDLAKGAAEVGRMLGGWLKYEGQRQQRAVECEQQPGFPLRSVVTPTGTTLARRPVRAAFTETAPVPTG